MNAVLREHALKFAHGGLSPSAITTELTRLGYAEPEARTAATLVDGWRAEAEASDAQVEHGNHLAVGFLWLAGGAAVTAVTFLAGGESFVLAWGPMLYGGAKLLRGLAG